MTRAARMVVPRFIHSQGRRREMELLRGSNSLSWPRPEMRYMSSVSSSRSTSTRSSTENESLPECCSASTTGRYFISYRSTNRPHSSWSCRDGDGDGFPVHDVCDDGVGTGQGEAGYAEGTHEYIGAIHDIDGPDVLDQRSLNAKDVQGVGGGNVCPHVGESPWS